MELEETWNETEFTSNGSTKTDVVDQNINKNLKS